MLNIDWENLKVIILDVDGTLYNQAKLRKKMLFQLLKYYLIRPLQLKEFLILYYFRLEREKMSGCETNDLESEQYIWCAKKLNVGTEKVKMIINKWIFEMPNLYLMQCRYAGVESFIELLKAHHIKTAIYSDYNAIQKLQCLNLKVDMTVASTDIHINSLKPNTKALNYIMKTMGVLNTACLFIGDRNDLDGKCAERAGIPFINIKDYDPNRFYQQLMTDFDQYKRKNDI